MNELQHQKEDCSCLLCGDMYTNPKKLECGHIFCYQCLLEKKGPAECPDPACGRKTVPEKGQVTLLETDVEMADRIKLLLREGR